MLLNTSKLESHILKEYEKLKTVTTIDCVYRPLSTYFGTRTPNDIDGSYCYSDGNAYFYCGTERGRTEVHITTTDLPQLVYWVLESDITDMASNYEYKNRTLYEDSRRVRFQKEKEYFSAISTEYGIMTEAKINKILKIAPYDDNNAIRSGLVRDFETIAQKILELNLGDNDFSQRFNHSINYFINMGYRVPLHENALRKYSGIPDFEKAFENMVSNFEIIACELKQKALPRKYNKLIDEINKIEETVSLIQRGLRAASG